MTQLRYTTPQSVTNDVARVTSIILDPIRGDVTVVYAIGSVSGSVFTANRTESLLIPAAQVPANITSVITTLNTRALSALQGRGLLPAGTEEAIP